MATGLIALLDDVAAIAKLAAASLDDVGVQAMKAGTKAAGVVIDDTAVTPRYVVGFAAERELPIVGKIAMGSLRNKLFILLPAAMLLSAFLPWSITPILMCGGLYLCYEGAEKLLEAVLPKAAHDHEQAVGLDLQNPRHLEDQKVAGAIRTDFILSAEIMAIALASIPEAGFLSQLVSLAVVAVGITVGVYGVVALIVKADDMGVALAASSLSGLRMCGRGLVHVMPGLLRTLAGIGTVAMLWVGGGILVHGLESFGVDVIGHAIDHLANALSAGQELVAWFVNALLTGVFGVVLGALLIPVVSGVVAPLWRRLAALRNRTGAAGSGG
ncbi:MAG: DUF808 domain-containing protein [Pseudomonadales bacterium]|nr:DUF808 domain-containing protein [Pseudomonadales bacterium]MCP5182982.1 DUF808 domain-containing protein [Pseudomonadales bacterium]